MHNLMAQVRRLIRWYLSPSGLLLATALSLFVIGLLWPSGARWFGGAGVVVLGVFLPYRFSRQQGVAHRRSDDLGEWITQVQHEVSHGASALRTSIDEVRGEQSLRLAASETQLQKLVARQNGKLTLFSQTQAGDREQLAEAIATQAATRDEIALVRAETQELQLRLQANSEAIATQAAATQAAATQAAAAQVASRDEIALVRAETQELQLQFQTFAAEVDPSSQQELGAEVEAIRVSLDSLSAAVTELPQVSSSTLQDLATKQSAEVRSDLLRLAAAEGPSIDQFDHLALIVSPERCGTTWTYDVLRSLPGSGQLASMSFYDTLGVKGNRYPHQLLNIDIVGEPVEIRPGVAGLLPSLRQARIAPTSQGLIAIEKAHPSAFDYDATTIVSGLDEVNRSQKRTSLILLIRDPLDAYLSFVSYMERAGWHKDLDVSEVPALFVASFETMSRLADTADDHTILAYEDLVRDPVAYFGAAAFQLGQKLDAAQISPVLDAADTWRNKARESPYFGEKTPKSLTASQLLVGRSLEASERSALEQARQLYESLWHKRLTA